MADDDWDPVLRAADALAPESTLFADHDVPRFGAALGLAARRVAARPWHSTAVGLRIAAAVSRAPAIAFERMLGGNPAPAFAVDARDRRFADPAWTENPAYALLLQYYIATGEITEQLLVTAGLNSMDERKARLALSLLRDALAPTNFLLGNPAALKRAFDTGGVSVLKGARNFLDDAMHNRGRPRQVDTSSFTIGQNLAATPCKVVYRNELMELLQYEPQTTSVHAAPLLCSPPWINKYYVMDLAPERSFIEWAVRQNRTVFAISYINPGPDMSHVTMDDYLVRGPRIAIDVVAEITGAETVDIVGLCLGGAMTAITTAYLAQIGDSRVGNLTLLNTMLDYSDPGPLAVFTESATVDRLERQMEGTGLLASESMAGTFDSLRANDLIFNYVVANWLKGESPPAFDLLAWNADGTRMPATMHAFYLRNFYVENRLALGTLDICGQRIMLGNVKNNTYVVSAENDHIVPWQSAYATTHLLSGTVRFILSSGGHIAGIVNPPGPKGWFLTGDELPPTAAAWRERATKHAGSWWQDWAVWSAAGAGELVDPPPMGSKRHPILGAGPGRYVLT